MHVDGVGGGLECRVPGSERERGESEGAGITRGEGRVDVGRGLVRGGDCKHGTEEQCEGWGGRADGDCAWEQSRACGGFDEGGCGEHKV